MRVSIVQLNAQQSNNPLQRDRLRRSAEDRRRYEAVKRELAARKWPTTQSYADAKSHVVESILSGCP